MRDTISNSVNEGLLGVPCSGKLTAIPVAGMTVMNAVGGIKEADGKVN